MFAGAAREAVFAQAAVIQRVQKRFIPVALKAGLINNPPDGLEGRLYREISRSKPAPQGICVVNSSGKALSWALSFDDDKSVVGFLDHCMERYRKHPNADKPCSTERYMKFPSHRMRSVADNGVRPVIPPEHADISHCPGKILVARGTVVARLIGRTVDANGKLSQDCASQENYIEELFHVPPELQSALVRAVRRADGKRVPVPGALANLLAQRAGLGQLDVMPGLADIDRAELWATRMATDDGGTWLQVDGKTEVDAGGDRSRRGDGARFHHAVKLSWHGFIRLQGDRFVDVVLSASGTEKLRWGNPRFHQNASRESDVAHLMAGRPIDKETRVRYGIRGRPAPIADTYVGDRPRHAVARRGQPPQRPRGGRPPSAVQSKLQRLNREVGRMLRQGRAREAERLLDEVLKRFDR